MTEQLKADNSSDRLRPIQYKRTGAKRTRGQLRNDILDAVRKALRNGSYETLYMEQVAAHASISRRTLYNLFTDKDELYRSSCERLIKMVADTVIDEIPERMSAADGLKFFVLSCTEVYNNPNAIDLLLSVVRDGASQPWLVQAYHREVHDRMVRVCENYVLKQSRRAPLPLGFPRYIGEQLVGTVKSLTIGPIIFGASKQLADPSVERLNLLASAYSKMIASNLIEVGMYERREALLNSRGV